MPADLAVIGLGHHGLPVAQAAPASAITPLGYDPDPRAVAELMAGRPPADGSLSAAELRRMLAAGFTATSDPADLGRVRTAALCLPTPLVEHRALDLSALESAA